MNDRERLGKNRRELKKLIDEYCEMTKAFWYFSDKGASYANEYRALQSRLEEKITLKTAAFFESGTATQDNTP